MGGTLSAIVSRNCRAVNSPFSAVAHQKRHFDERLRRTCEPGWGGHGSRVGVAVATITDGKVVEADAGRDPGGKPVTESTRGANEAGDGNEAIPSLLRHFADLRDRTHGGATSRAGKEGKFAAAVELIEPYARQVLAEMNAAMLLGTG